MDVLESMVGLQHELERRLNEQVATPEEARRANGELRAMMRERNNYFPEYEAEAQKVLASVGHTSGPLSHHVIADIAGHLGFSLHHVGDLPHSTRSVTDLEEPPNLPHAERSAATTTPVRCCCRRWATTSWATRRPPTTAIS